VLQSRLHVLPQHGTAAYERVRDGQHPGLKALALDGLLQRLLGLLVPLHVEVEVAQEIEVDRRVLRDGGGVAVVLQGGLSLPSPLSQVAHVLHDPVPGKGRVRLQGPRQGNAYPVVHVAGEITLGKVVVPGEVGHDLHGLRVGLQGLLTESPLVEEVPQVGVVEVVVGFEEEGLAVRLDDQPVLLFVGLAGPLIEEVEIDRVVLDAEDPGLLEELRHPGPGARGSRLPLQRLRVGEEGQAGQGPPAVDPVEVLEGAVVYGPDGQIPQVHAGLRLQAVVPDSLLQERVSPTDLSPVVQLGPAGPRPDGGGPAGQEPARPQGHQESRHGPRPLGGQGGSRDLPWPSHGQAPKKRATTLQTSAASSSESPG
jgi:hypothetical protein